MIRFVHVAIDLLQDEGGCVETYIRQRWKSAGPSRSEVW